MNCRRVTPILIAAVITIGWAAPPSAQPIHPDGLAQIQAILLEKATRTPDENKLDSNLLLAMRAVQRRNFGVLQTESAHVASFVQEHVASDSTVHVSIQGTLGEDLPGQLAALGARDVKGVRTYGEIIARVQIADLLTIAARQDVRFIGLFDPGASGRYLPSADETRVRLADLPREIAKIGSVSSQGVVAHAADKSHSTGITGTGIKICVMSDGVNSLAARQASGDLPASVDVVAGQAGSGDEGTAMLEIVYDMAPGATLGYATAQGGQAQMAANIQTLRNTPHNCNIIVDDWTYFLEPPFQEGVIAQAVTTVTAGGALYFSDAANSGNVAHGTSGTWEGDFVNGGSVGTPISGVELGTLHSFGANPYNTITAASGFGWYVLSWSDPMAASSNDYDLFILNSTGTTVQFQSTNRQTGTINPQEWVSTPTNLANSRIVVVNYQGTAAPRALRIDTERGRLAVATNGNTFGHNGGVNTITTAAVNVATAGGGVFVGGAANPVENFSSDGPRRLFYTPAGAAITPGNVLFATNGGTLLNKVDITAADGVTTTTPGFTTFFGTSAAAPHAAAIAALTWSAKPTAPAATIRSALFGSALDNEAAGWDVAGGAGIVMAPASVRAVLNPLGVAKAFSPSTINAGATATLTITLTNSNATGLSGVAFTNTYPASVVNAATPNAAIGGAGCLGTLTAGAGGGSLALTGGVIPAAGNCTFTVTVTSNTPGIYADASGGVTTPIALNSAAVSATLIVQTAQCVLDVDGNGRVDPATDGLILFRAMAGLTDAAAIAGGIGATPTRSTWNTIRPYINLSLLDVDGDGVVRADTDGLLLLRMMFKMTGNAVIANAVGIGASRPGWPAIRDYVNLQCGTSFN
jgi:hypothetical protein